MSGIPAVPQNEPEETGDLAFLRALFESALDAILVLDDERRCVEANPAARALFGFGGEDLAGWRLDERTREVGRRGLAEARAKLVAARARELESTPAADAA